MNFTEMVEKRFKKIEKKQTENNRMLLVFGIMFFGLLSVQTLR